MNKNGQVFFVAMMIGIVFILLALSFAPVIKEQTDIAMNSSTSTTVGLDCSNATISDYNKANCLFVDYMNPYFVGFLIFAAGAIITAKVIGG